MRVSRLLETARKTALERRPLAAWGGARATRGAADGARAFLSARFGVLQQSDDVVIGSKFLRRRAVFEQMAMLVAF